MEKALMKAGAFALATLVSIQAGAQPIEAWHYRLDRPDISVAMRVMDLADGGCVVAIHLSQPYEHNAHDFTRLTSVGDTLWICRCATHMRNYEGFRWLAEKEDGSVTFVAGDDAGVYFGRLSDDGTLFPPRYLTEGGSVWGATPTPDGGAVVNVWTGFILRCDSTGGLVWNRTWAEALPGMEHPSAVCATPDGGYLFAGQTDYLLDLAKVDSNGGPQWTRHYGIGAWPAVVKWFPGLGFFVAGGSTYGPFVVRVTESGDTLWLRQHPVWASFNGLDVCPDQSVLVAGSYEYCERYAMDGTLIDSWQQQDMTVVSDLATTPDGATFLCGWDDVVKLCGDDADVGSIAVISEAVDTVALRVSHVRGGIRTVTLYGLPPGTSAWTTGAAADWSVSYRGDTVMFEGSAPLVDGVLDTFWISEVSHRCAFRWAVGCKSDTANVLHARLEGLEFSGANYGFPHTDITIRVDVEHDVVAYEVWWMLWDGSFALAESFPAVNDSGPHDYVLQDRIGHSQWLLVIEDIYGCRYTFNDRMLILGQNVHADDPGTAAPSDYSLSSFPNPFNPSTTLSFSLPREARARIAVFDVLGREVAVLVDEMFDAGEHRVVFDGTALPSGLYFARLQSRDRMVTQKLLLLK